MSNRFLDKLIHRLRLARPPAYGLRFRGPVLVLGSAPVANPPAGFDDSFTVITVNGAQHHLQGWGAREPDVTFLTSSQFNEQTPKAASVRQVLAGHRTGSLYVVKSRQSRQELARVLKTLRYGYDDLHMFGRLQRMALYTRVTGKDNFETDIDSRFSNGITAVLFALHHGAQDVILSGIDPNSRGHVHDAGNKHRWHAETDSQVIDDLLRLGKRIYTCDAEVALRGAIPLWPGAQQTA